MNKRHESKLTIKNRAPKSEAFAFTDKSTGTK